MQFPSLDIVFLCFIGIPHREQGWRQYIMVCIHLLYGIYCFVGIELSSSESASSKAVTADIYDFVIDLVIERFV